MNIKNTVVALMFALLMASPLVAEQEILYKWVDADGITQLSDRPPKGVKYERIKVRKSSSGETTSSTGQSVKTDSEENAEVKQQISKAQAQMAEACKVAKANLHTLNTASRISVGADDGGKRLMTEEERAAKKKETQASIDNFCDEP